MPMPMHIVRDEENNIDIIESSKRHFSPENLKNYYNIETISQECLKLGLSAGVLTALPVSDPFFFPKPIIYYILGKSILAFIKALFPEGLTEKEINLLIKNSEQYAECRELYREYVKNIASFYKSINLKTALEIATFFDLNLESGMFNPKFESQDSRDFKYQNDYFLAEIAGSTVTTGKSICRHNAPFLTDILDCSGIKAYNLLVKSYSLQELKNNSNNLGSLRTNHMITGIIENDENFIYDPTKHCPGYFTISEILSGINPDHLILTADTANKSFGDSTCFIISEDSIILELYKRFNIDRKLVLENFINQKHKKPDFNYHEYLLKEGILTTIRYKKEILDFRQENSETVQKIKKLNETLNPRSDTKITNWKIK